jgi:hypothetical protein
MGTTLTGTKPKDTYDSLIKVTDNGPISGTAKYLSDGLGNDLPISVSTTNVGIGTSSPTGTYGKLTVAGTGITMSADGSGKLEIGRYSSGVANSYIKLGSTSTSLRVTNAADSQDIVVIENSTTGEKLRVLSSGGITFNGDTAAANALDDYEEGTFTPSLVYSTSGTPTYASQVGLYTKIGRNVQVHIVLAWNENGSLGNVTLQGLPFTAITSAARATPSIISFGLTGVLTSVTGLIVSNGTSIDLFLNDNAGTVLSSTYTDNDQDMYVTLTYQTA